MRWTPRGFDPIRRDSILRDVLALCAAGFVVGLSFGAIAAGAGLSVGQVAAMSALIYAGGAQFLAIGIVSAGGGGLAVVLAGLLLNARHLPFRVVVLAAAVTTAVLRLLGVPLAGSCGLTGPGRGWLARARSCRGPVCRRSRRTAGWAHGLPR